MSAKSSNTGNKQISTKKPPVRVDDNSSVKSIEKKQTEEDKKIVRVKDDRFPNLESQDANTLLNVMYCKTWIRDTLQDKFSVTHELYDLREKKKKERIEKLAQTLANKTDKERKLYEKQLAEKQAAKDKRQAEKDAKLKKMTKEEREKYELNEAKKKKKKLEEETTNKFKFQFSKGHVLLTKIIEALINDILDKAKGRCIQDPKDDRRKIIPSRALFETIKEYAPYYGCSMIDKITSSNVCDLKLSFFIDNSDLLKLCNDKNLYKVDKPQILINLMAVIATELSRLACLFSEYAKRSSLNYDCFKYACSAFFPQSNDSTFIDVANKCYEDCTKKNPESEKPDKPDNDNNDNNDDDKSVQHDTDDQQSDDDDEQYVNQSGNESNDDVVEDVVEEEEEVVATPKNAKRKN
jgi:hypothetical protein